MPLKSFDLIKTINDEDEVPNLSEESDEEIEFQPTKHKNKGSREFDSGFKFVSSTAEYNVDYWADVGKYIKRKAKRKTDDKIELLKNKKRTVSELQDESEDDHAKKDNDGESDFSLSDDDLKKDALKEKDRKKKKVKVEAEFSEEIVKNDELTSFYQMNLSRPLMKSVSAMNFTIPTPIQSATIPTALLGRDICGCAATGTGKTAAYMLPILERLLYRPKGGVAVTRVLVLVPTRELGVQVYQVSRQLAQFTTVEFGLSVGGLDVKVQEATLRRQPDVVIATPGRLIDHINNTPGFSLDSIEVLVLDEADRMLDDYFAEQMKEIVRQCARTRQTLLFSATMTTAVEDLARVSLNNPVKVFVDSNSDVAFNLRQEFVRIRKDRESDRDAILAALVCRTFSSNCIIFVQTKSQAHRLHILLGLLNITVAELHGNLTQPQRLDSLKRFRDGLADVLVATDVAARGLDIVGVKTVINYVLPYTLEHYIHRVGRTARAGRSGVSVSLAGEAERKLVKEIVKKARGTVKSRIIPQDILDKYKKKVDGAKEDVENILKEELEERLLEKSEKQMARLEKKLKDGSTGEEQQRGWFQTRQQRALEKARLNLEKSAKKKVTQLSGENPKQAKKKKKVTEESKEDKKNKHVALVQAKIAKKKGKFNKIRSMVDGCGAMDMSRMGAKKKKKSSFDDDLTNVSRRKVKGLRYESNKKQKTNGFGKKNNAQSKGRKKGAKRF